MVHGYDELLQKILNGSEMFRLPPSSVIIERSVLLDSIATSGVKTVHLEDLTRVRMILKST